MRDTAVSSTPRRRRSLRRAFTAFAAVPTALALGSGLFAAAPATAVDVTNQAQNSLFGSSDVTDYLDEQGVPYTEWLEALDLPTGRSLADWRHTLKIARGVPVCV